MYNIERISLLKIALATIWAILILRYVLAIFKKSYYFKQSLR